MQEEPTFCSTVTTSWWLESVLLDSFWAIVQGHILTHQLLALNSCTPPTANGSYILHTSNSSLKYGHGWGMSWFPQFSLPSTILPQVHVFLSCEEYPLPPRHCCKFFVTSLSHHFPVVTCLIKIYACKVFFCVLINNLGGSGSVCW